MFPQIHTLNFEAAEDAAPLGGGEAEEAWTGPDQETWEQMVETNNMLREAMTQQAPEPQYQNGQQPAVEIPDQYADPEGFAAWLHSQINETVAPVTQYQEQLQAAEGKEIGLDILADLESREGEFIMPDYSRQRAYELGDHYYAEMVERYGQTPKAAEAALVRGYKEAKEQEIAIGKAYHEREINQLATLSGAPRELAAAGAAGASQTDIPQGGNERSVVNRFFPQ